MPTPAPISATVEIAAPPADVWAVVSDVTRMPEWSPELRRLYAVGGRTAAGRDAARRDQPPRLGRLADHLDGGPARAAPRGRLEHPGERRDLELRARPSPAAAPG